MTMKSVIIDNSLWLTPKNREDNPLSREILQFFNDSPTSAEESLCRSSNDESSVRRRQQSHSHNSGAVSHQATSIPFDVYRPERSPIPAPYDPYSRLEINVNSLQQSYNHHSGAVSHQVTSISFDGYRPERCPIPAPHDAYSRPEINIIRLQRRPHTSFSHAVPQRQNIPAGTDLRAPDESILPSPPNAGSQERVTRRLRCPHNSLSLAVPQQQNVPAVTDLRGTDENSLPTRFNAGTQESIRGRLRRPHAVPQRQNVPAGVRATDENSQPSRSNGGTQESIRGREVPNVIETEDVAEMCSICLSDFDFEHDESIRSLPCKHLFHMDCMDQWVGMRTSATCPLCRERFF